jgi:hypothetical protein
MHQTVSDATISVNMITLADNAGDHVYNIGTIAETGSGNAASHAISFGNGAGDYLYNGAAGAVYGNVSVGNGASDYVYNAGFISGTFSLGNGVGDLYIGTAGQLYGAVVCGAGGDYIYTGSDVESIVAGKGNDSITCGDNGRTILTETASQQLSNGWDTVANFQTATGAPNVGTLIHLDAAMAATTNFIAFNGGTIIQMNLGGGLYSYIDVLGVGVSTVQAQTYFA